MAQIVVEWERRKSAVNDQGQSLRKPPDITLALRIPWLPYISCYGESL